MDGLEERGQITVIGTTEWVDAADPTRRRPGRFDRQFEFEIETGSPTERAARRYPIHPRRMLVADGVVPARTLEHTQG